MLGDVAMPDNAVTPNVFIDTEVFDSQGLDFASPNFMRLIRLATAGEVKLFLTTVTREEIKRHLDEHATKAFKQMGDYRRASRIVKKMLPPEALAALGTADEGAIRHDLHRDFTAFIDNTKTEILSINKVSPDAVFKRYFEQKPPFGDRHKKNEFPDAFACAALQAWCARTKSKMYVVSGDHDWKRVCAADPALIHLNRLDRLLEQFADSIIVTAIREFLVARKEEVEGLINSEAENLDYYISDNLIDGEYDDLEVSTEVEEFHVVEAADGQAVITAFCTVRIQAFITADDPNSMWTDPDTRDVKSVWQLRGSVEQENECDVTVSVTYDPKRPEDVKIGKVEFQDKSVEIEVEEGQLSCSAEDEVDDIDDIIVPDDL
jgi:hypothetical protein